LLSIGKLLSTLLNGISNFFWVENWLLNGENNGVPDVELANKSFLFLFSFLFFSFSIFWNCFDKVLFLRSRFNFSLGLSFNISLLLLFSLLSFSNIEEESSFLIS
jgi:hypothetical protein